MEKYAQSRIVPQQVQLFLNLDIVVTFKSVRDKQSFSNLDCVVSWELSYLQSDWVRVQFKHAKMKYSLAKETLNKHGSVLFFTENRIMDSDTLTSSTIAKMS